MGDTVFSVFAASAARHPARPLLHIPARACRDYSDSAIDLGYGEALERVLDLSARYGAAGYGAGNRVALLLENRPEFFLHWFALNRLGASVVPVNAEQPDRDMAWQLEHSGACLLVGLPGHAPLAGRALALMERPVPHADPDAAKFPAAPTPPRGGEPGPASECALLYTSGSTGKPKGCILANDYFTRFGSWYGHIGGLCELREGAERLITPLPLTHMNAMATSTMGMVMNGGCVVQLDRFHPSSWWQSVRESEATIVHYLGVMPAILLGLPPSPDDHAGASVRFGFGAGVNPRHHAPFEQRFGFPLIEAWAMTESGSGGCIIANREPRHVGSSCFGRPDPTVSVRLVDEQCRDVARGEPGELLVRATGADPRAGFFSGYLDDPAATAEIWADGWLHTGDVVREGPDGSLHFVDRRKNVIRRSGENIAALEVEAALALDPRIAEAVVTAVPDEIRGEEVMACIVAAPGQCTDRELALQLQATALSALSYFKAPGYVVFVDAVPRTPSQKPQRGEIRRLARERWLQDTRCFDLRALKRRPGSA